MLPNFKGVCGRGAAEAESVCVEVEAGREAGRDAQQRDHLLCQVESAHWSDSHRWSQAYQVLESGVYWDKTFGGNLHFRSPTQVPILQNLINVN